MYLHIVIPAKVGIGSVPLGVIAKLASLLPLRIEPNIGVPKLSQFKRWRKPVGVGLMLSAIIAVIAILAITFQMFRSWLSGENDWVYAASWLNAAIAAYGWTALWAGVWLYTDYSRLRLLAILMLFSGVCIAGISISEEIAKGGKVPPLW